MGGPGRPLLPPGGHTRRCHLAGRNRPAGVGSSFWSAADGLGGGACGVDGDPRVRPAAFWAGGGQRGRGTTQPSAARGSSAALIGVRIRVWGPGGIFGGQSYLPRAGAQLWRSWPRRKVHSLSGFLLGGRAGPALVTPPQPITLSTTGEWRTPPKKSYKPAHSPARAPGWETPSCAEIPQPGGARQGARDAHLAAPGPRRPGSRCLVGRRGRPSGQSAGPHGGAANRALGQDGGRAGSCSGGRRTPWAGTEAARTRVRLSAAGP